MAGLFRSLTTVFAVGMIGGAGSLMLLPAADPERPIFARAPIADPPARSCKRQTWPNIDRACQPWTAPKREETRFVARARNSGAVVEHPGTVEDATVGVGVGTRSAEREVPVAPAVVLPAAPVATAQAPVKQAEAKPVAAQAAAVPPAQPAPAQLQKSPMQQLTPAERVRQAFAQDAMEQAMQQAPAAPRAAPPVPQPAPAPAIPEPASAPPEPAPGAPAPAERSQAPAASDAPVTVAAPAPPPSAPARPASAAPRSKSERSAIQVTATRPDGSRRTITIRPTSKQDAMYYAARPQISTVAR